MANAEGRRADGYVAGVVARHQVVTLEAARKEGNDEMTEAKHWTIDVYIDEYEERTRAKARLHNRDKTGLVGVGLARLNPADVNVPEIGDELAVARALADLSHMLLEAAVADIETVTHEAAHLTR